MNYELDLIHMQVQYPSDLPRLQTELSEKEVSSNVQPAAFRPAETFTIDPCKYGKRAVRRPCVKETGPLRTYRQQQSV